ncbi:hypothetical protein E1B28_003903 [Marasmius oreades]|uniref:Uncharacterized protein n=1 Tax=Marasmius oreades TaxID=181124 RepID=A0A9P7UXL7_9AGAR|nr:uncharacterized protein E1B28_003903 [Marasmius oreades]KAG7096470.1 hypothetical protein E1B28_003903 [Marasmius oreades]
MTTTATTTCNGAALEALPHSIRVSGVPFNPSSQSQISSCLFSSLLIKNIASSTLGPLSLSLQRNETFPAPRFIIGHPEGPNTTDPPGWFINPTKPHSNTLVVELEEKLGAGRTGIAYSARIVDGGSSIPGSPRPTHVCIKFAMPYHCRSLAREAWFYDQLPEEQKFQGIITPRYYGFFTSSLGDVSTIVPWEEGEVDMSLTAPEDYDEEGDLHPDFLPEDRLESTAVVVNDAYTSSNWYDWQADPKNPLVSVLVLEKLGGVFKWEEGNSSQAAVRDMSDLKEIMTDLTAAYIVHADARRFNFLKAPEDSLSICPRHGHAHRHRVIDFDRSFKTDENVMQRDPWWREINVATMGYPQFWCQFSG